VKKFIECQTLIISPFCPHYSEHVWSELLGNKDGIMKASWPSVGSIDPLLIRTNTYFDKTLSDLRSKVEKSRSKKTVTTMTVFVAEEFLDWQQAALGVLKATVDAGGDVTHKDFKKSFMQMEAMKPFKAQSKVLMPFAAFTIDDYVVRGAEAFELKVPYDETEVLIPPPPPQSPGPVRVMPKLCSRCTPWPCSGECGVTCRVTCRVTYGHLDMLFACAGWGGNGGVLPLV